MSAPQVTITDRDATGGVVAIGILDGILDDHLDDALTDGVEGVTVHYTDGRQRTVRVYEAPPAE